MRAPPLLALLAALVLPGVAAAQAELVGGLAYERRATRDETLESMLAKLRPATGRWGEWWLASPFPFAGHGTGDLAAPRGPEDELRALVAGGAGPDLSRVFAGKRDALVRWQPLGRTTDRRIGLNVHDDPELDDEACCYLYTTVHADEPLRVPVTMGSDDGLRFWLNGELLVDQDVERGLGPEDVSLELPLAAGSNHLLVKVTEGAGDWAYQINTRRPLDSRTDAALHWLVDRDFPPAPDRVAFDVFTVPLPNDLVLEVGGLALLGDGRPVVTTRRGDVWLVEGAYDEPPFDARFLRYASGLHEPLGAAVRWDPDGEALYVVQRGELTRLLDVDGDDRADVYETICDGWGLSGNYHEFAFGPRFDADGTAWVTLNLGFCGGLGKSIVPWRGWALRITPDGGISPVCDGLRSPNGIVHFGGTTFYLDNQGDYVATNRLSELVPGSWHGHPSSLAWREGLPGFEYEPAPPAPEQKPGAGGASGDASAPAVPPLVADAPPLVTGASPLPADVPPLDTDVPPLDTDAPPLSADVPPLDTDAPSPLPAEAPPPDDAPGDAYAPAPGRPRRQPPSVWFPYKKMGQSAADAVVDQTGGTFGPFTGQLFVGDQTLAAVMRVFLERVDGHWQGACFPFVEALDCGVNRLAFAPDGSLFVGQTDRGWASIGRRSYGLQRIVWRGVVPFEILSLHALPDGFRLVFTRDVDPGPAADPASYALKSYTYAYHADYGAPESERAELSVLAAVLEDARTLRLRVHPLRADFVHELAADGVRSAEGEPLVHPRAYYTLVRIPAQDGER